MCIYEYPLCLKRFDKGVKVSRCQMVPHSRSIAWETHEGDRMPPGGNGLNKRAKTLLIIPAPPRRSVRDRQELGPGELVSGD